MGASITLLSIDEELTGSISLEKLVMEYYQSVDDGKGVMGLDTVFEVAVKKHCFEISEMLDYFSLGFKWSGDCEIEMYEGNFIASDKLLLDVIDWFIALCYIYNIEDEVLVNPVTYVDEAINIKNNYGAEYEFFSFSYHTFIDLKEKIQSDSNQNYLWVNSI